MKTLIKLIKGFFIFLGVIFFIIILFLAYMWFSDPFNIKPIFFAENNSETIMNDQGVDTNPLLNQSQEDTVRSLGINPASLPSEITPEMEACFKIKLGEERVAQILNGDTPGAADLLKAGECLNN